ncbi:MAG: YdcF family protein [Planctomycetales bacterium]|nr:YdcF family protein [Planctomycetales bacterium]
MIYTTIVKLMQPYPLLMLLTVLALVRLWWRVPEARRATLWVALPLGLFIAHSTTVVTHQVARMLEEPYPYLKAPPENAQAIVVLGAGVYPADEVVPVAWIGERATFRCLEAARLYHAGRARPVLVSGGIVDPTLDAPSEAELMRDLLIRLGVPDNDILLESASTDTWSNAVASSRRLKEAAIEEVVLVTDATHMGRAVRCFESQALRVTPAASDYETAGFLNRPQDYLPSVDAAETSEEVFHEWLGTIVFWLQGKR